MKYINVKDVKKDLFMILIKTGLFITCVRVLPKIFIGIEGAVK